MKIGDLVKITSVDPKCIDPEYKNDYIVWRIYREYEALKGRIRWKLEPAYIEGYETKNVTYEGIKPLQDVPGWGRSTLMKGIWVYEDMLSLITPVKDTDEIFRVIYSTGSRREIGIAPERLAKMTIRELMKELLTDDKVKIEESGNDAGDLPAVDFSYADNGHTAVLALGPRV